MSTQESLDEIFAQIDATRLEFDRGIANLADEQSIRAEQAKFLAKQGKVGAFMRHVPKLAPTDRPKLGAKVNELKAHIEATVEAKLGELSNAARQKDLDRTVDVTMPGRTVPRGHLHLLTQVRRESVEIFAELGFAVAEGPQVETDWHNFEALAIPKDHPARDMQDTFYLGDEILLRTHTSPVQVRTMISHAPPIRIIAPGQVFRRDDDPTHSPMFTQLEGLAVDEGLRFSDLKGVLLHYIQRFFGKKLEIRFRPSYFQFVEPGAEIDMQCSFCGGTGCRICKGTGWVEIGGCGMVDPDVFSHVKIDSERFTGFAFGMGLERMAMLRHDVNDIKFYYEGDVRFLGQF